MPTGEMFRSLSMSPKVRSKVDHETILHLYITFRKHLTGRYGRVVKAID